MLLSCFCGSCAPPLLPQRERGRGVRACCRKIYLEAFRDQSLASSLLSLASYLLSDTPLSAIISAAIDSAGL